MTTARRTFTELPVPQLPALLRGSAHVPDRRVDAANRSRLVRARADEVTAVPTRLADRGRRDGVHAVPAVHALRPLRRRDHRPPRRAPPRPRHADRPDDRGHRPHVARLLRHRGAVDAVRDRVRERHDHGARRAFAPAADVPDGRARGSAKRDRAQLEPLQRVADPRPVGGGDPARVRGRRSLLPRQRDQLRRGDRRPAADADERVLPARGVRPAEVPGPERRRDSRSCGRSHGCSPCSR